MAFEARVSAAAPKYEVSAKQRGFSSSPSNPKHTLVIPADLRPPPTRNKYRSPNSSANQSPKQRSQTPITRAEKENGSSRLSDTRPQSHSKPLRESNTPVPKLLLPTGNKPIKARVDCEEPEAKDGSKMDEIIKRYKREIVDQTHKMQEFRRNMVDYDANLKHLLTTVSEEKKQTQSEIVLMEKNREIEELRAQLQVQPSSCEMERLNKLVRDMASEITSLKGQITQQKSDLLQLETVTKERDELKRQMSEPHELTQKDFEDLSSTIKELEEMQNSLLRENNSLKEELIREQRRVLTVPSTQDNESGYKVKAACKEVHYVHKDLSQLTHLLESLRSGGDVNLSFLLGAGGREAETGLELLGEVELLKTQLGSVKLLVSDLYAEHCGSSCAAQ